jgi:hypothetical protein
MIEITETQNKVLEAYLERGAYSEIGKEVKMSFHRVKTAVKQLYALGVIRQRSFGEGSRGPILTGVPYRVLPDPADTEAPSDISGVRMTPKEEEWMRKHYKKYRRNRSEAAKILGRSRYDVNAMAIKLGLGRRY